MLIGTEITLVTGNDVDSSPALSYSLQLDPTALGKFGIHRYSGGVSLTAPLDFEEKTWYTLTVRATDSQHQTEANITILVEDINDNVPAFTHNLYQVGRCSFFFHCIPVCVDSAERNLTYPLLPEKIHISSIFKWLISLRLIKFDRELNSYRKFLYSRLLHHEGENCTCSHVHTL